MEVEIKENGRVIIPSKVMKALGLRTGDKMELKIVRGILQLRPTQIRKANDIYGIAKLKKVRLGKSLTVNEIEKAVDRGMAS